MDPWRHKDFSTWRDELKEFLEQAGRVPQGNGETVLERSLAGWLQRTRDTNKNGFLCKEHKALLAELPGMRERLAKWEDALRDDPDPKELAAASGLDKKLLAALPPDAPIGHAAYKKASYRRNQQIVIFSYGERKINFQTTLTNTGGIRYAAERICRACYVEFEKGMSKDQVLQFRTGCYAKFMAALQKGSNAEPVPAAAGDAASSKHGPPDSKPTASAGKKQRTSSRKAKDPPRRKPAEVVALSDDEEQVDPVQEHISEAPAEATCALTQAVGEPPVDEPPAGPLNSAAEGAQPDAVAPPANDKTEGSGPEAAVDSLMEMATLFAQVEEEADPQFSYLSNEPSAEAGLGKEGTDIGPSEDNDEQLMAALQEGTQTDDAAAAEAVSRKPGRPTASSGKKQRSTTPKKAKDPPSTRPVEAVAPSHSDEAPSTIQDCFNDPLFYDSEEASEGASQESCHQDVVSDPYCMMDFLEEPAASAGPAEPSADPGLSGETAASAEQEASTILGFSKEAEADDEQERVGADSAALAAAHDDGEPHADGPSSLPPLSAAEDARPDDAAPTADTSTEGAPSAPKLRLLFPGGGGRKSRLQWVWPEMAAVFDGRSTLTCAAVEELLAQPGAERLRALGLTETCKTVARSLPPPGEVSADDFIDCVLQTSVDFFAPPLSFFRDASPEELRAFPHIFSDFRAYLVEAGYKQSSTTAFVRGVWLLVHFDRKSLEEMITEAYRQFVVHTFEDGVSNNCMSVGLKKFAAFWEQPGRRPLADYAAMALPAPPEKHPWALRPGFKQRKPHYEGDGSEEARSAESLPEGWHVHRTSGRIIGCTSPRGTFFKNRTFRNRLYPPPPPVLALPPAPPSPVEQPPPPPPEKTPEKMKAPPKPRVKPTQTLEEACGPPPPSEAASERDRKLCPQVIATFRRYLAETTNTAIHTQQVRNTYTWLLFRVFTKSGRSFEAIAQRALYDLVLNCIENRRSHGSYTASLRRFATFWQEWGGYEATYDKADRETLQVTLNVKPVIVDAPGFCGAGGIASEPCKRPKQRCETCGLVMRCSQHEDHTAQACREIFWATHLPDGSRSRSITQFFNERQAKLVDGQSAEPALIIEDSYAKFMEAFHEGSSAQVAPAAAAEAVSRKHGLPDSEETTSPGKRQRTDSSSQPKDPSGRNAAEVVALSDSDEEPAANAGREEISTSSGLSSEAFATAGQGERCGSSGLSGETQANDGQKERSNGPGLSGEASDIAWEEGVSTSLGISNEAPAEADEPCVGPPTAAEGSGLEPACDTLMEMGLLFAQAEDEEDLMASQSSYSSDEPCAEAVAGEDGMAVELPEEPAANAGWEELGASPGPSGEAPATAGQNSSGCASETQVNPEQERVSADSAPSSEAPAWASHDEPPADQPSAGPPSSAAEDAPSNVAASPANGTPAGEPSTPMLRLTFPGAWRKPRLQWARPALTGAFEGRDTLTCAAVEDLLEQPRAERLRMLGFAETCKSVAQNLPPPGEVLVDEFIDCVLHTRADFFAPPLSFFRDASSEELRAMPYVISDFKDYLVAIGYKASSVHSFVRSLWAVANFDRKSPEEMVTEAYRQFVIHTVEDAVSHNCMSVALKKFADFWEQSGRQSMADYAAASPEPDRKHMWAFRQGGRPRKPHTDGDGSEEAREADSLPEGWHVHKTCTRGDRILGCSSPRGTFYKHKMFVSRLHPPPPPFFELPPPPLPPAALPPPPAPDKTPEKARVPARPRVDGRPMPTQTMEELCGQPPASEAASERDRKLCPQVIATFRRYLAEAAPELSTQKGRINYTMLLFRLFTKTGRSFEAMAQPSFYELVKNSIENRKTHGSYTSSLRKFSSFWEECGGYEATFDKSDWGALQASLNMKPVISDAPGLCGARGICSAELCKWPKQRCETCGLVLRCSQHEKHTEQACKDMFWATYLPDGTRVRKIAQFFNEHKAKRAKSQSAEPSLIED